MAMKELKITPKKKAFLRSKEFLQKVNNKWQVEIPAEIRESLQLKTQDIVSVNIRKVDEDDFQEFLKQLIHDGILI